MSSIVKPAIDPELVPLLAMFPKESALGTLDGIIKTRAFMAPQMLPSIASSDPEIEAKEISFVGPEGNTIELCVMRLKKPAGGKRPCLYNIHGGGMVLGTRHMFIAGLFPLVKAFDLVAVSVEYRRAPEAKAPAQVEDTYASLKYVAEHASELGIDAEKIVVHGGSAGGGLAAGVVLLARDRKGPAVFAQSLLYPMIDDRNDTLSAKQFWDEGTYTGLKNQESWDHMVPNRGKDDVSYYVAPARATDLSGMPKTYIEVGSAEPFRDENVAYAMKMWEHGNDCELHVWPGGLHGYDVFGAGAQISKDAIAARWTWLRRVFGQPTA